MSLGIIVQTWGNTLRFLIIFCLSFLIIYWIIDSLSENTDFKIDYSNDKALVTIIDKKFVATTSVLPACDCWTNTGIEVWPGEEYQIKVSGKIHTTADKMVKDAEADMMPRFRWIDGGGDDFRIRKGRYFLSDSLRKTLLISQKAKIGQVLLYFRKGNSPTPNCELGLGFYIPDSLIVYDSAEGITGQNSSKEKLYIWATVNDMLIRKFDNNTKLAYVGGTVKDTLKKKEGHWNKLVEENYNRIWYDDNFGNFVISAKITKSKNIFGY